MFLCGVEVEVSFSALFSNVLVAFATVKTTGPQTQDCTVTLSSKPVNIFFFFLNYHLVKRFCNLYKNHRTCTKAQKKTDYRSNKPLTSRNCS